MEDLPPRQRAVLEFVRTSIEEQGRPPTYREIGEALGISSTNGVADHVRALVRKGFLEKVPGSPRGLRLVGALRTPVDRRSRRVPLVGTVAAGSPILAEENHEGSLLADPELFPRADFALRVRGDSMIEEGIYDGDVVLVRRTSEARNGDIVVALIDGEATVKFFFRERDRVRLQPAHPTMEPIYVDPRDDAVIQGVVVGVLRTYGA